MVGMEFLHVIVMFAFVLLVTGWMIGVCDALFKGRLFNWLCEKKWMIAPIGVLLLIFIARVWYVVLFDIQDMVNYIFGLCGCSPIDLKNFG